MKSELLVFIFAESYWKVQQVPTALPQQLWWFNFQGNGNYILLLSFILITASARWYAVIAYFLVDVIQLWYLVT